MPELIVVTYFEEIAAVIEYPYTYELTRFGLDDLSSC